MVATGRAFLRQLLVSSYDDLKRRLTRRFGSADMATEVLHETWLRLDQIAEIPAVRRPQSYLYRMALNVAVDRRRAETRWSDKAALETLLRFDADQLDPEHIAAMRSEVMALERALAELPARRRAIFTTALVEELPYRDIAARFGLSLRSVEREMSLAFEHCSTRLEKAWGQRRVGAARNVLQMDTAPDGAAGHDHDD
jgi:RNA polymerase sigma-70 factor (ECF subfamily)